MMTPGGLLRQTFCMSAIRLSGGENRSIARYRQPSCPRTGRFAGSLGSRTGSRLPSTRTPMPPVASGPQPSPAPSPRGPDLAPNELLKFLVTRGLAPVRVYKYLDEFIPDRPFPRALRRGPSSYGLSAVVGDEERPGYPLPRPSAILPRLR